MKISLVDPLAPELRKGWLSFLPVFDGEGEGGGDDGDDDDDGDDTDDGDDADEDGEDDDDKDPPKDEEADARLKRLERSLRRARGESRKWKALANKGTENDKNKDQQDNGPDFRASAAVTTAVTALKDAGFTGAQRKAIKLLADFDLSTIEPDGRGFFDPEDFEDVIEDLKEEWPELFEAKRPVRRSTRSRDDDEDDEPRRRAPMRRSAPPQTNRSGGGKKLNADEEFAARIAAQAGYTSIERRVRSGRG